METSRLFVAAWAPHHITVGFKGFKDVKAKRIEQEEALAMLTTEKQWHCHVHSGRVGAILAELLKKEIPVAPNERGVVEMITNSKMLFVCHDKWAHAANNIDEEDEKLIWVIVEPINA